MAVAETNKIITHGDGQAIAQSIQNLADSINTQDLNVTKGGDQEITGLKSFVNEQGLKTNKVSSTDGQDLLSYDGTNTSLKGKGTRPLYNDGEMALLSDVGTSVYANMGTYRWMGRSLPQISWKNVISDPIAKYYSDYFWTFGFCKFVDAAGSTMNSDVTFDEKVIFSTSWRNCNYMFNGFKCKAAIYLPNMKISSGYEMFNRSEFTKILVADGCEVTISGDISLMFYNCSNLTEIGAIDLSNASWVESDGNAPFRNCSFLKSIHMTNFKYSFDISYSTAFEEADLVEIIGNLVDVGSAKTLTIGDTNKAKLTAEEIAVATIKGWSIA